MMCRKGVVMLKQVLASIVVVFVWAGLAYGQAKPNMVSGETTATATVDRIEKNSRALTLKTADNGLMMMYVDPSVKEFDSLKAGDVVTVRYVESVVAEVKPGAALSTLRDTTDEARRAGNDDVTQQQKMVVVVDSIEFQGQAIVYRTADGLKVIRYVTDKKLIEGLRPGDRVEVTLTRQRAVSIERTRK